jgi:hypothetical protein
LARLLGTHSLRQLRYGKKGSEQAGLQHLRNDFVHFVAWMISLRNRVIRVRKVLSACTNKLSHCPSAEPGRHPGFTVLPSFANFAAFLGVLCGSSFEMIQVKVKPSIARTQRNVAHDAKRVRQSEP